MLLICFGTRPEWLKIKPILDVLDPSQYELLYVKQHTDLIDPSIKNYNIKYEIDITQSVKSESRLNSILYQTLLDFPEIEDYYVMVQGDTASALACALATFNQRYLGNYVIHLEAGLRTRELDFPYPEEGYRQLISRISSIHLCPTKDAKKSLLNEDVHSKVIFVTGNTSLDNLVDRLPNVVRGNKVLVTLHRFENLIDIPDWFESIEALATAYDELDFIFPMHPNPELRKYSTIFQHVKVIDPLEHSKMLDIMQECRFIITDSGGIQEEGSFLKKKVFVCRSHTERQEGIASNHLVLCPTPVDLETNVIDSLEFDSLYVSDECPFGDGKSAIKIKNILKGIHIL